ncbi:MAG: hypothetical protein WDO24_19130 [Pseudomonadota bacterium]
MLRRSDLLLSLMLSAHTSYPPLEFAACGGLAIHNTYATKTAARLTALSANIIAVEPTVAGHRGWSAPRRGRARSPAPRTRACDCRRAGMRRCATSFQRPFGCSGTARRQSA